MADHGATIKIVSWFLLIVSGGVVATRIGTKWLIARKSITDTILIICALLCNVAAGIAVSIAAENGLGQPPAGLTDEKIVRMQKAIYVTEIFYILTLCLSKLSLIVLLHVVSALTSHSRVALVAGGFVVVWALTSIFAVLFQCPTPDVWDLVSGTCNDMRAFWRYFGALNIITEVSFFAVPSVMIYRLHMGLKKRLVVIGCFSVRLLDIAVTAIQIHYTNGFHPPDDPATQSHSSLSLTLWPWFLCGQVLQTVSLISACMPYLREFLEAFPSGMFQPDEIRRRGLTYVDVSLGFTDRDAYGTKGYTLTDLSSGSRNHPTTLSNTSVNMTRTTVSSATDSLGAIRSILRSHRVPVADDEMAINVQQTVHVTDAPAES